MQNFDSTNGCIRRLSTWLCRIGHTAPLRLLRLGIRGFHNQHRELYNYQPERSSFGSTSYGGALTPSPSVSSSSNAVSNPTTVGTAISNASASLQYYVEVLGPASTVQVTFNGFGNVSGSFTQPGNDEFSGIGVDAKLGIQGLFLDETNISISDYGGSFENGFAPSLTDNGFNSTGTPAGGYSGSFLDTRTLMLLTGQSYLLKLQVTANSQGQSGMSAMAAALGIPPSQLRAEWRTPASIRSNSAPASAMAPLLRRRNQARGRLSA